MHRCHRCRYHGEVNLDETRANLAQQFLECPTNVAKGQRLRASFLVAFLNQLVRLKLSQLAHQWHDVGEILLPVRWPPEVEFPQPQ